MRKKQLSFTRTMGLLREAFSLKVISISLRSLLGDFPIIHGLISSQIRAVGFKPDQSGQISLLVCV